MFSFFFNFRYSVDDSLTDTNVYIYISYLAWSCDIEGQGACFPHQKALKKLLMSQPSFTCSNLTIETVEKKGQICSKLRTKTPEQRQWQLG